MEPNLSFLASRPVSPGTNEASGAPSSPAPSSGSLEKSDFAQVLNGQTLKAQRQHLAAIEAPGQGLQVVPLGNKINVITSDAPLPDMASLAHFARMQGLDEVAVQALFGTSPVTKAGALIPATSAADALAASLVNSDPLGLAATLTQSPISGLALPSASTAAAANPAQPSGPTPLDGIQTLLASPAAQDLKVEVQILSVPQTAPVPAVPVPTRSGADLLTPPTTPLPAAIAAAPPTLIAVKPAPAPVLALSPLPAATEVSDVAPVATALAATAVQSSLLPMQPKAWLGQAEVTAVDAADAAHPLAPQDAVRLTLAMPAPEITKRLAQMSGTGKETTWAALLASGPASKDLPAATDTVTLDLPAGFDADLLVPASDSRLSTPSDLSTQAGAATTTGASVSTADATGGSNAGNAQAQADHRAQQFQQLADQMGQVAAQRLMAQIERGQWKMQMRMQPATLGSINVELDMHAGGLDALFSTDNAVTRDLMAQGSNKLRDTLTQSGMTVASVSVNGEQSRQSGGNSTPGKGRGTPFASPAASVSASAAASPAQAGPVAENDGLNLLA